MTSSRTKHRSKGFIRKYLLLLLGMGTTALILAFAFFDRLTTTDKKCWTFIDKRGNAIIENFEFGMPFSEDLAPIKKDGLWGYIDSTGKWKIPPQFDGGAAQFSEGIASVTLHGQSTYIDKSGNFITDKRFSRTLSFKDGIAVVGVEGPQGLRFGCIDRSGNYKIPPEYTIDKLPRRRSSIAKELDTNTDILRPLERNGRYGYVDKNKTFKIQPNFLDAGKFSDSLAAVKTDSGLYGYINDCGVMVIPAQFEIAGHFSEGLAIAGERTGWNVADGVPINKLGIIDKQGNFIVPKILLSATPYKDGLSLVRLIDCDALRKKEK